MEIKVKATGKEIYRFSLYHFFHSPISFFYLALLALSVAVRLWAPVKNSPVLNLLLFILMGYMFFKVVSLRQKADAQADDPVAGAMVAFKFEYNGIRIRQNGELTVLKWEDIKEVRKIGEMYVLYPAPRQGLLIPCRLLLKGREERFLGLLQKHMTDRQLKKLHLKKTGETK